MKRSEYERLKKLIEDEYRRKLDALEVVWQMVATSAKPPVPGDGSSHFAKMIGDLIDRLPARFTVKEVESHLASMTQGAPINRSTVSHALKRMSVDQSKIRVSAVGAGKRPTVYERVAPKANGGHLRQGDPVVDELRELVQGQKIILSRFKLEVLRARYGVEFVRDLSDEQVGQLREELKSGSLASLAEPLNGEATGN